MENEPEGQEPHKTPEGEPKPQEGGEQTPQSPTPEELAELKRKAEVSFQNFERAKKAEAEAKVLKEQLEKSKAPAKSLDVDDYIDISASLEGLDQKEKTRLAEEHKLTGKPLNEIRQSEDFLLWQSAWRAKVEKERALKPSNVQEDTPKEKTMAEKLAAASLEEKEKLLTEAGYYKSFRPRSDRANIGGNNFLK